MPDIGALLPAGVGDSILLTEALTHRSHGGRHNERLEFLGDAVLSLVVASVTYERLPDATEGDLSRLRAALVNRQSLSQLARSVNIGERLQLGQGELKSGGVRRESTLADALEAVIGAVYLECGFDVVRDFIVNLYGDLLVDLPESESLKDPKTRLQEFLQGRARPLPVYEIVEETGEAHSRHFLTRCRIVDTGIETTGEGVSRRIAEQEAAEKALARLHDGT